jgi:hypothetical protein
MATILPVHNVHCLWLVDICLSGNISWFVYAVLVEWVKTEGEVVVACGLFGGTIAEFAWLH